MFHANFSCIIGVSVGVVQKPHAGVICIEMTIYCLINSNHRLTGPEPGRALPAVRGVLIGDTVIDVPRLKQMNGLVNYVAWEILLIWNLLYHIWKNYW